MSLKIIKDDSDNGTLTIELNNGDYKALNDIVEKWKFKDRENALRFGMAVLAVTERGTLCKEEASGNRKLIPTDDISGEEHGSKD